MRLRPRGEQADGGRNGQAAGRDCRSERGGVPLVRAVMCSRDPTPGVGRLLQIAWGATRVARRRAPVRGNSRSTR